MIFFSKALGARRVVCVDVNDERLSLAVKMGADVVVNSTKIKDLREELMRLTGGDGFSRSVMSSKAIGRFSKNIPLYLP